MRKISVQASQLDNKITIKEIEREFQSRFTASIDGSHYLIPKKWKYIFYYKFNTIVFIWFTQEEVSFRLSNLKDSHEKYEEISQEYQIIVDPKLEKDFLITQNFVKISSEDLMYFEIISILLAQSVVLDYYEIVIESLSPKNITFYEEIKKTGKINLPDKEILKIWASALSIKHQIVSNLFLLDKPEITWDDGVVEKFYENLYSFLDLKDRFRALEYKINMIHDDIVFLNELLNYKKWHLMEVIIILLIAFEIGFTLFEHFFK